jgi:BON domain
MPNPLELLTKPLQIGAQLAFGAIQNIQRLLSGGGGDDERAQREPAEQPRPQPRRQSSRRPKPLDDATITDKVETILFRDKSVAKGKIDVNTANGKVWLRGEARTPEQIKELEAKVREVPEVKDVENLLHLPKTPANKREKRHSPPRARTTPKRTTAERKTSGAANAEPTPRELAAKGEGRQPAPLGSSGPASPNGSSDSAE